MTTKSFLIACSAAACPREYLRDQIELAIHRRRVDVLIEPIVDVSFRGPSYARRWRHKHLLGVLRTTICRGIRALSHSSMRRDGFGVFRPTNHF
jgi:hypothetical protein